MRTIEQAGDLKGKKVFLRIDLDVPVSKDGIIEEEFRVVRQRENLQWLLDQDAQVVMAGHISAVPSVEPLAQQLQRLLGVQFQFCRDFDEAQQFLAGTGSLALLENLRTNPGEQENREAFAKQLVVGCDLYVNNAFAVCHREHASVATAPMIVPSYAGLLVTEECKQLRAVIDAPAAGKVVFMGGAKVETKMPVITHMLEKAEVIAVGGKLANELGASPDAKVLVPSDFVTADGAALDIGPQTSERYAELARDAKLIIWNGPMGKFEDERYFAGTRVLAQAIAAASAQKIIGGGDTVSAVDKLGLLDKMGFVSTGGGAMLAFLAGQQLPGLKALGYYDEKDQR